MDVAGRSKEISCLDQKSCDGVEKVGKLKIETVSNSSRDEVTKIVNETNDDDEEEEEDGDSDEDDVDGGKDLEREDADSEDDSETIDDEVDDEDDNRSISDDNNGSESDEDIQKVSQQGTATVQTDTDQTVKHLLLKQFSKIETFASSQSKFQNNTPCDTDLSEKYKQALVKSIGSKTSCMTKGYKKHFDRHFIFSKFYERPSSMSGEYKAEVRKSESLKMDNDVNAFDRSRDISSALGNFVKESAYSKMNVYPVLDKEFLSERQITNVYKESRSNLKETERTVISENLPAKFCIIDHQNEHIMKSPEKDRQNPPAKFRKIDHHNEQTVPSNEEQSESSLAKFHKIEHQNQQKPNLSSSFSSQASEAEKDLPISGSDTDTYAEDSLGERDSDSSSPNLKGNIALGGRFEALNAGPALLKTGGQLFGMMGRIADRNRHTCEECGRTFNQVRILKIHKQMHASKRNRTSQQDCGEENNLHESPVQSVLSSEKLVESAMSCEKPNMEEALSSVEETLPRSCLQEVPEHQLNNGKLVSERKQSEPRKSGKPDVEKRYACNVCGKAFSLQCFLRRHQITHTGEKPFACQFCGKCFGQKASRQRHEATHNGKKPYLCNECGDRFSSSSKLEKHVKKKHSKPEPLYDCKYCENKFATKKDAEAHEQIHPKVEKPHVCMICEKAFSQRSHLERHRLSHSGEKPHKCKDCGKGFSQKAACRRHERTHVGDLLYICTECGNSFAQKSGLQKHRLIHSGEKPYSCQFCKRKFTQKTTCQRHERIHTGEKPYVCQQCGRAFGQSTSLERHVRTHMKSTIPTPVVTVAVKTAESTESKV